MDTTLPKKVQNIMDKFTQAGYQIFIVGGAVRDLLLGKAVVDWDFTTDAKPEEILKLFPEGFYDNKFGTVGIPLELITNEQGVAGEGDPRRVPAGRFLTEDIGRGQSPTGPRAVEVYEITTMRKEGEYEDFRHPSEVAWTDKIEEDLARRDFTINAMALRPRPESSNSLIIDPFLGQRDLENKLVRAVGDPNKRFKEDALRLMRAVRIAAQLDFKIEEKTRQAILDNAQLIKEVANERVRDELFKILASLNPYVGITRLREAGILEIILPESEKTFGVSQEGPKHTRTYDIGEHSLLTLKETPSSDPLVRLAALLHDIGKPDTMQVEENGNVTFYNHDVVGGHLVLHIARRLNLSRKQTDKLFRLVRWHLFTVDEKQTDSAIRRFIKNVGTENIDDMIALRIGDRLGGGTQKAVSWRMEEFKKRIKEVRKKPFTVVDLKVDGNDVMKILNIPPGPKVGEVLERLFEEVVENNIENKRESLLKKIKELSFT